MSDEIVILASCIRRDRLAIWLRTQLYNPDGNGAAETVPQVREIGDDHAFEFLRFGFTRQQTQPDALLDARDLRLAP
ncbi:hypothetical protein [Burkholderia oklahomensis]|uniref:hypothetical protein n=1 Tax=Burkholderia oklahomensis TaxID=342113 RepID=UPI0012F51D21|nr:hypothetical protein [Burkholderia oklahomensis]MBI0362847.1 hypothetical protein [Burkholderia oklahomensis]